METESSTKVPTKNLRDTLLDALKILPGTRDFHIHVLETSPRRNTSLYQFAKPRPRTYVQDVLVLLSEEGGAGAEENKKKPRVLVTAVEANLYIVPGTASGILYVCKVDSTGQSSGPSPTKALVGAFLKYYADPRTRPVKGMRNLWIQLFARAQGQYLFPNSSMWEGKKPLNDVKLCAWWKRMLGQVALNIGTTSSGTNVQAYYVLPGYGELEAKCTFNVGDDGGIGWTYGHPYGMLKGLPCPAETQNRNLGHYIPYFVDDPKSRFLDEIAYTNTGDQIKSPARKRVRTEAGRVSVEEGAGKEKEDERAPLGELSKVTADEFWERMSFRQECVAGAITGFFCVVILTEDEKLEGVLSVEQQPGQVSAQINKRVLTALTTGLEFSTTDRAVKATETLESTIRRLCEGGTDEPYSASIYGTVRVENSAQAGVQEVQTGTVRVLTARKKRK